MKKYFIPYELAKQLIELGFDEKTFDVYNDGRFKMDSRHNIPHTKKIIWEQAFSWLLNHPNIIDKGYYLTEKSRGNWDISKENENHFETILDFSPKSECLKKLIEIVKIKQHE